MTASRADILTEVGVSVLIPIGVPLKVQLARIGTLPLIVAYILTGLLALYFKFEDVNAMEVVPADTTDMVTDCDEESARSALCAITVNWYVRLPVRDSDRILTFEAVVEPLNTLLQDCRYLDNVTKRHDH